MFPVALVSFAGVVVVAGVAVAVLVLVFVAGIAVAVVVFVLVAAFHCSTHVSISL